MRIALLPSLLLLTLLLLPAGWAGHAQAHDWYGELRSPRGTSCCGGQDCRPVEHRITEQDGDQILIDGAWMKVDPSLVLPTVSPDGRTHACYRHTPPIAGSGSGPTTVFCIILPGSA